MTRYWFGLSSTVIVLALACGPDTGGIGSGSADSSGSGSGSGSGTGSVTATSSMNPTATATNGSADGTGSTGVADGSSTSAEVTTSPETTTNGDATDTSTGGSSSSGGPPPESYPGCMVDADCSDPYDLCWPPPEFGMPNFCTLECTGPGDCPLPTSGGATPVCEGPPGTDICALDCSMGDCPDGMDCVDIFGNGAFLRCTRP